MMPTTSFLPPPLQNDLLEFAQSLVRIQSYSGQEEEIIRFIAQKMTALGYDEVRIDAMGIPTIGFGPGEYKLAHMRNESCEVQQIVDACGFYTNLVRQIQ